jgi:hypothetical protein
VHDQRYRSFVTLVKVGIAVAAIIVVLMAYFLNVGQLRLCPSSDGGLGRLFCGRRANCWFNG